MAYLFPNENFFKKTVKIVFMCILGSFTVRHFQKKSLEPIQSYKDAPISGLKWLIYPKQIFFSQKSLI